MTPSVERLDLAPDLTISRVLNGMWQIADMERHGAPLDAEVAAAAMKPYLEAGLTTFDMADHYGSAEDIAGLFSSRHDPGGQSQLLTKWVPGPGRVSAEKVRTAVQRSLDRLRADRLDLLQFHAWNYADPGWLDCLFRLQELKEEGLIRHLGLTNFDTAHLRIVLHSGIDVVSNQVCVSLLDQRARWGLTDLCSKHGIHLLTFGTLAGGFLAGHWLGRSEPGWQELKTWSQMKYKRFIDAAGGWERFQRVLRTVESVADRNRVSIANVACRYVLDQPAVGGIIIGVRLGQTEHIEDTLRLFQFGLSESDRTEIASCLSLLEPIPGDCGDEYRRPPFLTASGDLSHHVQEVPPPYEAKLSRDGRTRVLSGTPWEAMAGYCRALRRGDRIWVSGTTATHGERLIGGTDPAAQLHFIIDKIEGALQSLGGRLEDVVRTRLYARDIKSWETLARVHGERFGRIRPVNTLVQASLVGEQYLVEMEADAVLPGRPAGPPSGLA